MKVLTQFLTTASAVMIASGANAQEAVPSLTVSLLLRTVQQLKNRALS